MPVIIGLGNPGNKYVGTRHNVGFELIDRLAASLSVSLSPGKGPFVTGKGKYRDEKIILAKPTTYMNLSGEAVQKILHWFKKPPEKALICYDDLDIELGTIRIRAKGSAGGHNGIKDIIQKLGTDSFPRLRIGIGNDFPKSQQINYVLSRFTPAEREDIDKALENAEKAVYSYLKKGLEQTMNNFN